MKHLIIWARCLQPWLPRRLMEPPLIGPHHHPSWSELVTSGPRVWIAITDCGQGFHGQGEFPHETLRFCMDETDAGWCPKCRAEIWGYRPSSAEFGEPSLRKEAEAKGFA